MVNMLDPAKEIDRMEKDIVQRQADVDSIKVLFARLPDLQIYRYGKSDNFISCSATMNSVVDNYDANHRDTEYLDEFGINTVKADPKLVDMWLFTIVDGHKVYANPPCYTVGHENESGFGIVPVKDWELHMEMNNISLTAIRKVRAYLKSKPEISW